MPHECSCTKTFTFHLTFPLTSFPLSLSRDAEEKKEEKKRRKKRKTGQATLGPDPAATATPTTPPRAIGEEEDRASTDTQSAPGAASAPSMTEPPSAGGTPETKGAAAAAPAIGNITTAPEAPSTAAPFSTRTAPEPRGERRTASTGPGPSRAPSPPLPEILGRPARIKAEPHAADPWAGVLAAMTGALRDEVVRARTAKEARIDEGWALLHQATERCRLLDQRAAKHREQARKEAEEIRASAVEEAEEALANTRESARGVLARAHQEAMEIISEACQKIPPTVGPPNTALAGEEAKRVAQHLLDQARTNADGLLANA
jgi:F0F1-type ATP synthase membrane subunit b/b'